MLNRFMERPTRIRVMGISGSLRQASFNSSLLRVAQEEAPAGMEIAVHDLSPLPFYNRDMEEQGDPGPVADFKAAIREADGALFVTPEYNYSPSAALKNAIDWASRDRDPRSLFGKPVTTMGAGGFAGTARAQMHLHNVFAETGSHVMSKPGVYVSYARQKFDSEGNLIDEPTREAVRNHLKAFANWILLLGRPRD